MEPFTRNIHEFQIQQPKPVKVGDIWYKFVLDKNNIALKQWKIIEIFEENGFPYVKLENQTPYIAQHINPLLDKVFQTLEEAAVDFSKKQFKEIAKIEDELKLAKNRIFDLAELACQSDPTTNVVDWRKLIFGVNTN